jgi:uracil phosphoribosyltransferase
MDKVILVKHPLIDHSLTILRDKTTSLEEFRKHSAIVSKILFLESTKNLNLKPKNVQTPLEKFEGRELSEKVIVIPVLRAGLAMLFALQEILPTVSVGFIGLERDEKTAIARQYYQKFPKIEKHNNVIVIDPMLATGGSIDNTLEILKEKGIEDVVIVSVLSAPEGLERINKKYPNVIIFTAAIDKGLNDVKYILPGLGDYGDRYFGTEVL